MITIRLGSEIYKKLKHKYAHNSLNVIITEHANLQIVYTVIVEDAASSFRTYILPFMVHV